MTGVVVTGAGGFLGRPLLAALTRRGFNVHALGRDRAPTLLSSHVQWHSVDLLDRSATRALLGRIRAVGLIHLAWETAHGEYWESPKNLDWTASSEYLLRDFQEFGGRRAVIAGSSAEYEWSGMSALDERRTPLQPASLYGQSKNALREFVENWAPNAGISWAWGRIFNIYGPHEKPERLVPKTIETLQRGLKLRFDDGSLVRDFLHVEDAADAFAALFVSPYVGTVNIGSGEPVAIRDVIGEIAAKIGRPELVEFGALPAPAEASTYLVASVERLRNAVGWTPKGCLSDRLRETCEWWQLIESRTAKENR